MRKVGKQFDEAMLEHVKQLKVKTVAFGGYDKNDVFEQIKNLLDKARGVCIDIARQTEEETVLRMSEEEKHDRPLFADDEAAFRKEDVTDEDTIESEAAAPAISDEELRELRAKAEQLDIAESTIEALQRELQAVERECQEAREHEEASRHALAEAEKTSSEREETLRRERERFEQEKAELAEQKSERPAQEETLVEASSILNEARLEGARLINEARAKIDQEILLGRAQRREEEEAMKREISELTDERDKLQAVCDRYSDYLSGGSELMERLTDYAVRGSKLADPAFEPDDAAPESPQTEA